MNISFLETYHFRIFYYQFFYGFLIISLLVLLVLELVFLKHTFSFEVEGMVLEKNNLSITLLTNEEVEMVLNSKEIRIENKKQPIRDIDIEKIENKYLIRLQLNEGYRKNEVLKVQFILKEENLYQFVVRVLKGEI